MMVKHQEGKERTGEREGDGRSSHCSKQAVSLILPNFLVNCLVPLSVTRLPLQTLRRPSFLLTFVKVSLSATSSGGIPRPLWLRPRCSVSVAPLIGQVP